MLVRSSTAMQCQDQMIQDSTHILGGGLSHILLHYVHARRCSAPAICYQLTYLPIMAVSKTEVDCAMAQVLCLWTSHKTCPQTGQDT